MKAAIAETTFLFSPRSRAGNIGTQCDRMVAVDVGTSDWWPRNQVPWPAAKSPGAPPVWTKTVRVSGPIRPSRRAATRPAIALPVYTGSSTRPSVRAASRMASLQESVWSA